MMIIQADPVPIRQEADGTLRVGSSRVLLELILDAFEEGGTPESIVLDYPSLRLSDVYSVISHYLNHREAVVEYLRLREANAKEVACKILSTQRDLGDIRRRLLSPSGSAEDRDAPPRRR